ncbi:MAG: sugar transferase [Candidatus Pacebacteria bacterium]|nr:sugar transferase [Candidatus Paceibacterota bacterium]
MLKRLFDIIFSFIGLILTSPLFLVVAVLIKISSPGPVFYRGERIGRNGKPFRIFKFRTMVVGAENLGGPSTASDDPRLLKIGNFLKKFQLDEIPQLINVLKGEMSFVGPRPEVKIYVDMMTSEERSIILSATPGMTDLASLWDFHEGEILKGSADPEKAYMEKIRPTKIKLQLEYVKTRSFVLDLKIIFKTIMKVFH